MDRLNCSLQLFALIERLCARLYSGLQMEGEESTARKGTRGCQETESTLRNFLNPSSSTHASTNTHPYACKSQAIFMLDSEGRILSTELLFSESTAAGHLNYMRILVSYNRPFLSSSPQFCFAIATYLRQLVNVLYTVNTVEYAPCRCKL